MDDTVREHLNVHQLVLRVVEDVGQAAAILLLEMQVCLPGLAGHPLPDDRIHGVIRATAVHADPAQLLPLGPVGKLAVGTGMLHHVADLIRRGHVPTKVMEAGVDDEDVARLHLHLVLNHFRRVDVIVRHDVRQIHHRGIMDKKVHLQIGHVLTGGVEVNLTVEVRAQMVRMGQQLPIRAVGRQPLKILHLQRLIGRPRGRGNPKGNGQIQQLHSETSCIVMDKR